MDRFAHLVERRLGLVFEGGDRERLSHALLHRLPSPQRVTAYLDDLEAGCEAGVPTALDELAALASDLTVGETYFLRQPDQFRVLTHSVLPDRMSRPDRPLQPTTESPYTRPLAPRVLSAGCASGEEAYSLAIALAEAGYPDARVTGIDVNPAALAKARAGRYTSWSMRAVPPLTQRHWFSTSDQHFSVVPKLLAAVDFRARNLAAPDPAFWRPTFDVIFCRNVLMYFSPTMMADVVHRLASALLPGGYLFLGSAETLRGLSEEFGLRETDGTFYYQLADPAAPAPAPTRPRVRALPRPRPVPGPESLSAADFQQVLDLIRAERYGAALGAMERIPVPTSPPRTTRETEVVLVRAVLLTQSGDLAGAGRDAHRLLGQGVSVSADAHAVLATGREADSDPRGALLHWRAAADADPRFAIAHLQLGRLSRAGGDPRGAARAYDRAAELLPHETERRVLLFGGGFDRGALLSVCRTMSRGGAS
ncbi:hypothetical protein JCM9957A_68540 [Kineosporia succinea]